MTMAIPLVEMGWVIVLTWDIMDRVSGVQELVIGKVEL